MIPFRPVNYSLNAVGKNLASSKFKYIWEIEMEGITHSIEFWDSRTSGYKRYLVDRVNENSKGMYYYLEKLKNFHFNSTSIHIQF